VEPLEKELDALDLHISNPDVVGKNGKIKGFNGACLFTS
jgi:hypothetical protein